MTGDRTPDERPGEDASPFPRASASRDRVWHILTGEYPPARGGVGDYTRRLAEALARAGREVHVWAPSPAETLHGVHLHPATFGSGALEGLGYDLDRFPAPRRLLVQYAPQAFGARGMNVGFARWVRARARAGDDVRVMFHEPYFPFVLRRPQRNLISVATRAMAVLLLRAARRAYVSTPAWEELLRPWAPARLDPMRWLPIPATVPRVDDPEAVTLLRAQLRGGDPERHVVGHFGTYGALVAPLLEPALTTILSPPANTVALLLGEGGPEFAERLERAAPGLRGRIVAPGWLPPERVSVHLQACDVAVQPYPDGASTRRTTLMAALANGVPTVTTGGRFTEPVWAESPVAMVPANDAAALSVAVLDLLDDAARRRKAGDAARAFYDARFAMERTIDVLLEEE
ncbi:MAG TPA: glycosyltransferase family 4 protein [Longimicrobium sp.]|nr:glycosyltransferase family 4 protein [Longimicrobium sp.]